MQRRRVASLLATAFLVLAAAASAADSVTVAPVELGGQAVVGVRFGGNGSDWGRRIRCSGDTCAIFGQTNTSFGESTDLIVMVEAAEHRLRWARTYGGTHRDELADAAPAADGGYLLIGSSQSFFVTAPKTMSPSRPPRPLLVKVDAMGTAQWARTLDDAAVSALSAVAPLPGGGHVGVGSGRRRGALGMVALRVDPDGRMVWTRRYDFGENTGATAVLSRRADLLVVGYAFAGRTVTAAIVLAIKANGEPRWARRYSTTPALVPLDVAADTDGNLVVVGPASGSASESQPAAMKLRPDGAWAWTRVYQGPKAGEAFAVTAGAGGTFAIAGRMGDANLNEQDGLALHVDAQGHLLSALAVSGDGNVALTGITSWRDGRYRLVGDTDAFGAVGVDILSLIWAPARSRESVTISSSEARTEAKAVTPGVVSLTPKVVDVKPSQLVRAVLAVPSARP